MKNFFAWGLLCVIGVYAAQQPQRVLPQGYLHRRPIPTGFGGAYTIPAGRVRTPSPPPPSYEHLVLVPILNQENLADEMQSIAGRPVELAYAHIIEGGKICYRILEGDSFAGGVTLEDVGNLLWFFYACAVNKGQAFEEGAYILVDPAQQFFNFLQSSRLGKRRVSSHLKHITVPHYGLDAQGVFTFPPFNKGTLLYAHLENGLTFMKPENFGVEKPIDLAMHAIEFIEAQARKMPSIQKAFGMRRDDDPGYAKERVPAPTLQQFEKIVRRHGMMRESMAKAKTEGIGFMYTSAIEQQSTLNRQQKRDQELDDFVAALQLLFDHLAIRTGREVIFTPDELVISAYYYNTPQLPATTRSVFEDFVQFTYALGTYRQDPDGAHAELCLAAAEAFSEAPLQISNARVQRVVNGVQVLVNSSLMASEGQEPIERCTALARLDLFPAQMGMGGGGRA